MKTFGIISKTNIFRKKFLSKLNKIICILVIYKRKIDTHYCYFRLIELPSFILEKKTLNNTGFYDLSFYVELTKTLLFK